MIAGQRVQAEDGVPLMYFCDMDDQYWDTYKKISEQFRLLLP
jgi:hypothetical protein